MYRIQLSDFEGPLDLLLYFIRRDELDVLNIPIARIADEYLSYVRVLEQVDLDSVGDFLYMAALLISIKAKMLLPVQDTDEEGEPIDPRRELVERLLEYIRFKEASAQLADRHDDRLDRFTRGRSSAPPSEAQDESDVEIASSVFDLIAALRRVLTEAPPEPTHEIRREEYDIDTQQDYVRRRLTPGERLSFVALVKTHSRAFIIATFLAVLEMARQGLVRVVVPASVLDFYLEPAAEGDGAASPAPEAAPADAT